MPAIDCAEERWQHYGRVWAYTYCIKALRVYSLQAYREACAIARAFGVPVRWKLEVSRSGVIHVHIAAPLPSIAAPPGWTYAQPIRSLRAYLRYMEKPLDARLCQQDRRRSGKAVDPDTYRRDYWDALHDEGAARHDRRMDGKSRLLPQKGWEGSRRPSAPLLPVLLLVLPSLLLVHLALRLWKRLTHLERLMEATACRAARLLAHPTLTRLPTCSGVRPNRRVHRAARSGRDRGPPVLGAGPA